MSKISKFDWFSNCLNNCKNWHDWVSYSKLIEFQAQNYLWFRIKPKKRVFERAQNASWGLPLYFHCTTQVSTWVKHDKVAQKFIDPSASYRVIISHILLIFSDLGHLKFQWKMMKNSKTGNEPKLKDPNISMRFKSDFSHVPLLAEPQNQI